MVPKQCECRETYLGYATYLCPVHDEDYDDHVSHDNYEKYCEMIRTEWPGLFPLTYDQWITWNQVMDEYADKNDEELLGDGTDSGTELDVQA